MYEFNIPNMTCGHCVSTVTKAIKEAAPDAVANVDVMKRKAMVETSAAASVISAAVKAAGYTIELQQ
jgi:copper chaperone